VTTKKPKTPKTPKTPKKTERPAPRTETPPIVTPIVTMWRVDFDSLHRRVRNANAEADHFERQSLARFKENMELRGQVEVLSKQAEKLNGELHSARRLYDAEVNARLSIGNELIKARDELKHVTAEREKLRRAAAAALEEDPLPTDAIWWQSLRAVLNGILDFPVEGLPFHLETHHEKSRMLQAIGGAVRVYGDRKRQEVMRQRAGDNTEGTNEANLRAELKRTKEELQLVTAERNATRTETAGPKLEATTLVLELDGVAKSVTGPVLIPAGSTRLDVRMPGAPASPQWANSVTLKIDGQTMLSVAAGDPRAMPSARGDLAAFIETRVQRDRALGALDHARAELRLLKQQAETSLRPDERAQFERLKQVLGQVRAAHRAAANDRTNLRAELKVVDDILNNVTMPREQGANGRKRTLLALLERCRLAVEATPDVSKRLAHLQKLERALLELTDFAKGNHVLTQRLHMLELYRAPGWPVWGV